jgi:hypothetical protein
MRRALRRAGWALAAAGGIGITSPALAQERTVRILGPGGHVEQAGEVIVITEAQARLEEGQVELALLADPMLFSYGLGAHVQAGSLELRGFVPTEAVRDEALKVAREQSTLHVIDKLKIQPNLATRCSVEKPEVIQRAAKELLEDAVPVYGQGMEVKCDARGRVTVSGRVASSEDRLLVSRKLRQVTGCSCVVNHLEVVGAAESRPAETTGAVLVPDAVPVPALPAVRKSEPAVSPVPARTVTMPHPVEGEPPSLGMPRAVQPEKVVPPPAPPATPYPTAIPTPKESMSPVLPAPRVVQEPVALPPAPPVVKPLPELPPAPKPIAPPPVEVAPPPVKTEFHAPTPSSDRDRPHGSGTSGAAAIELPPVEQPKPPPVKVPEVEKPKAPPAVKAPEPAVSLPPVEQPKLPVVKLPEEVHPKPAPTVSLPPSGQPKPPPVVTVPEVEKPKPVPTIKVPVVVNVPAAPAPKPPPLPPIVPLTTRPSVNPPPPPVIEKSPRGGSEESYVTEGTITIDDDPRPAKPVTAPKPAPTPAKGSISFEADPPPAKPVTAPKAQQTPAKAPATLPPLPATSPAPAPVKQPVTTPKAPPTPTSVKPAEGTMSLKPPPMPPSKPASDPVKLSAPPAKPPAPPAPPRPTVPPAVRLKERVQGLCGPAYEVKVTARAKNNLMLEITGRTSGEGETVMKKIRPVLDSAEFAEFEINVDVVTPARKLSLALTPSPACAILPRRRHPAGGGSTSWPTRTRRPAGACLWSSPRTTRNPESARRSPRPTTPWPASRRSTKSSSWTTAATTPPRRPSPRRRRAGRGCGCCGTRPTAATARRCGPGSRPPASSASHSPTPIASSTSTTCLACSP